MSAATTTAASMNRIPSNRWERNVPVYGFPVVNGFFLGLLALVLVAFALSGYRELAGLGPVSGMNDVRAVLSTISSSVPRDSTLAVMSRNTSSSAPSAA